MKKSIVLIGATGTVGKCVLSVILQNQDRFELEALVAQNNYKELAQQAITFKVKHLIIENEKHLDALKNLLDIHNVKITAGKQAVLDFISQSSSMIFIASSGTTSIEYFYTALALNKDIAIANKESIVCSGELLPNYLKSYTGKLIPVDSEHNSLFQLLENTNSIDVEGVIITGSGGTFIDHSLEELKHITKQDALKHPNWSMGAKITIDSSTFMNKALEVIEASYLFNIEPNKIDVIIHRQSILHAGINLKDGTFLGNFYYPSMNVPVAYALSYPNRVRSGVKALSLPDISNLKFEKLNEHRFSSIKMAKYALQIGGNYPSILNIANEVAVQAYLDDRIKFSSIIDTVDLALNAIPHQKYTSIEDIAEDYKIISNQVNEYINKMNKD
jgi:1-deoxy-D-xylulose-5-phosphate reductoisomerase